MIERTVSDEYLVFLIRQNIAEAHKELFNRYKSFLEAQVIKQRLTLRLLRLDVMLVSLELLTCFYSALDAYDYSSGYFYLFWRLIYRQHLRIIIEKEYKFISRDDGMIHLDEEIDGDGEKNMSLHESYTDYDHYHPSVRLANELYDRISDHSDDAVSNDERIVLLYYSEGESLSSIARIIGKPLCFVRRQFSKASDKIKKLFSQSQSPILHFFRLIHFKLITNIVCGKVVPSKGVFLCGKKQHLYVKSAFLGTTKQVN